MEFRAVEKNLKHYILNIILFHIVGVREQRHRIVHVHLGMHVQFSWGRAVD